MLHSSGYLFVELPDRLFLHNLVAPIFIGKSPGKVFEVNHKNGNKKNNYWWNLEWLTRGENIRHAYVTGLRFPMYGKDNLAAKLTDKNVLCIRKLYLGNEYTQIELARDFGVTQSTIGKIVNRKTWLHI